jgi:Fic family protein
MFLPTFRYTETIVNRLTFIAEAKTFISKSPLVPNWEVSLRKSAILRSAHSSTAIEGNPLTLDEVTALSEGREVMVRRKDRQEVLNYLEALEKISEFSSNTSFTIEDLLDIHKTVTVNTLNNPADEGTFRDRQVVIGNPITGEVTFRPPDTEEVLRLVTDFYKWFNAPETKEINPVIVAGITHYEIVRIHPFIDGNGRTARIMATLVLYRSGFDVKRFFALDDYYDHDRNGYYDALNSVDPDILDLTYWLEYFTEGFAVSIKSVKEKVLKLSKDIKLLEEKGQITLNDRQMKIVEIIVEKGKIANKDVQKMFQISHSSAYDELKKLLDLKVITSKGKGRSTHYILIT